MILPQRNPLIVEQEKIIGYLLNPEHRYGAGKAKFFAAYGFKTEEWEVLAHALREHGQNNEIRETIETEFGPRYEVEGELITPDGRRPRVRTVWQLDEGAIAPRLITAYPVEIDHDQGT